MQLDQTRLLRAVNRSERLRELLAASIRTGIRQVLDYDMQLSEARDLARVHTLSSALRGIEEKMQLHEAIRDRQHRIKLAIHETIIGGAREKQLTRDDFDTVRRSRELTLIVETDKSRKVTIAKILRLQIEICEWGNDYWYFLRSLCRLYQQRRQELDDLTLDNTSSKQAFVELDQLFLEALERSSRIDRQSGPP